MDMNIPLSKTDRIMQELRASQPDRTPCIELVDPDMVRILRSKTPAERLAIAWGMWTFARDTLRRSVAAQHPDWSEIEVNREAARRLVYES
jgi:F0F1-type ATP synthase epsilon subunit